MSRDPVCALIGTALIVVVGLLTPGYAEESPARITLEKQVHFSAPDGSDVLVREGDYDVAGSESALLLFPVEGTQPITIQATPSTHEEEIGEGIPIVISVAEEGENADIHHLVMLLAGGKSLDAAGTYSGIKSRGLRDRLAQRPLLNKAVQAGQAVLTKPEEARVEVSSPRVPPTSIPVGAEITFSDAGGWTRKVCQWIGGPVISYRQWGCLSNIDLANGRIQVKADFFTGPRLRWTRAAEAWVEMFKEFTVPPQAESGQGQTRIATFNVPVEYHGKALTTYPLYSKASYKILLMLDEVSYEAGPAYKTFQLESRVLAEDTVKAGIKMVKGIPIPVPDGALATQKNPVYFSAPVVPGRVYRLTLRVEVEATHVPLNIKPPADLFGSAVNFMDKAMILSEQQRVDGYIKWGNVRVRINP